MKKMPLGKLSKQQIARGFEVLEELEAALQEQPPQAAHLEDLSSRFYTIVPHNFGRARPPPINSPDLLRAKKDMLLVRCRGTQWMASFPKEGSCLWGREVRAGGWACPDHPARCPAPAVRMSPVCACQVLADIEVAQSLQAQKVKEEEEEEEEVTHPLDQDYALLCCQLSLLDPASREYQVLLVPRCPMTGSNHARPTGTSKVPLSQGDRGHCWDGCLR